ncbi:STEROL REGULATORY ELEMENT-BINDING PROTEIN [Salix koriyanagi]|uniref:STEROL REGULATORY ELEMENT-BINDING PROTEIN n=1 Tax=Salix koriyanagi TaxID=2511006 RepID=A0A9Q0Q8W6_9ROSI|nr:STEROL REGULATORY ELEMENT-BINDING PROTEIN [Salix koriyanagi]
MVVGTPDYREEDQVIQAVTLTMGQMRKQSLPTRKVQRESKREKLPKSSVSRKLERARREKISAKMRLLQSLVPGCDGITGKAHILDEIIRHVQSLKDRVESLEAELVLVNETAINDFKMNYNMEAQAWHENLDPPILSAPSFEDGHFQGNQQLWKGMKDYLAAWISESACFSIS